MTDFFNPPPVKEYFIDLIFDRSKYGYDSFTTVGPGYINPGVFKHCGNSIGLGLGALRVNNIVQEFSYLKTQNFSASFDGINVKQKLSSLFMDNIYLHQISHDFWVRLLVGVGLFYTDYETTYQINSLTYTEDQRNVIIGFRLGAGLRYRFSKHFASNIDYKYQFPTDKIKYITGVSLSLSYIF